MDNSESKLRTGFFQRFQQTLFGVPRVLFCLEPTGLAVSILVRDRHSRPEGVLSRFLAKVWVPEIVAGQFRKFWHGLPFPAMSPPNSDDPSARRVHRGG